MTEYEYALTEFSSGNYSYQPLQVDFGDHSLFFEFTFPEYLYKEFLDLQVQLANKADGDPLTDERRSLYIRDYDWLSWYMDIPDDADEEWLKEQDYLPLSIWRAKEPLTLLAYTKYLAQEINSRVQTYEQMLKWSFKSYLLDGTTVCTGYVQIGGEYENQNTEYSFSFISDYVDKIGFEDLSRVTILFKVKD